MTRLEIVVRLLAGTLADPTQGTIRLSDLDFVPYFDLAERLVKEEQRRINLEAEKRYREDREERKR